MSNVQSYNALIDRFHAFASGHFILKRFSHGQIEVSDLEKFGEYPFMHVVPSNVSYAKGTKTFSFQIVLADLPRDKEDKPEYQREVLSDLQRIAEDLVAEITNHRVLFGDLITVQNVSLEPFLEEFQHTLTGWTISLDLLVPYYWDACSIPAEWNDFFESGSGGTGSILTFIDSITRDENGNVSLVNDEATPAPNYYYGTNNAGVRGWYLLTDEVGLTCATIGTCQTIIDIEAAIDALEEEIVLKADITSISAVGFSNDYNDLSNLPTIPAAQVNSDWNATSGVAQILNKPTLTNGTVTNVTATSPMSSTGGAAPNLSMTSANGTTNGYLLSSDWLIFNNKFNTPSGTTLQYVRGDGSLATFPTITSGTVTSVAALTLGTTGTDLSSTVATSTTTPVITLNVPTASATNRGALSSADWTTFNGKQAALVSGTNIKTINSTSLLGSGNVAVEPTITAGTTGQYYRGDKTFQTLDKTAVGLANVDNTSDASKPISTATQTALNLKEDSANKQNSLAVDGTGLKFPTVDAVNSLSFIDKGKRMVSFFTDFLTNATLDGAQGFASGGSLGLVVGSQIPNRTNQQGVAFFQTNTVATNYINYCSSSGTPQLWFGGGAWNYEALINISNLSTALERYRISFGFGSVISNSSESDGVFITYDEGGTANGTAASANWQCVTVANSVRTLTTSTTAVTASAWNKLRIEINAAGTSVAFYVNGTLVATHTTNIPLASNSRYVLMKTGLAKTIGTTSRGFYCDYIGYENILTTAR